jgi:hypothetical protein
VVQFDTKRKTLPRFDILSCILLETLGNPPLKVDDRTAAAWLSSARAVGCLLKCRNERNPYRMFNSHTKLPRLFGGEEGGDDVKSAWRLYLGPHTSYNGKKQWVAKP